MATWHVLVVVGEPEIAELTVPGRVICMAGQRRPNVIRICCWR
jgi:hypothetical protein